ncbi:Imm1 family immunity protein [Actinoplanes palleronii]|uniref:Immunity protein Imm1 n=2 Tax=Actinoplanes palleronii TaxID=113570 RepID=A0ABQ4BFP7_9ACTN|nr:Imm1 family immunity protein [Actinoplanes palleronii]GIE69511.1 hypothetical protein Apa02nite_056190 [Actinoplanes palleronii]
MTNFKAEARYRTEHAERPILLETAESIDLLVDALLNGPDDHNLAQLHSLNRPLLPAYGDPDHELLVGVDSVLGFGALAWMDADGNQVTLGSGEGLAQAEMYFIMGHRREFPEKSSVPLDLIRQAVKEFLLSGGKRPTCVEWQKLEYW